MKHLITLVFLLSGIAHAAVTEKCSNEIPFGIPIIKKNVVQLCKTGYVSLYDAKAKIPALVTYVLEAEELSQCVDRDSSFTEDKELSPEQRSSTKDYRKSGYDMGHMANAADFRWSPEAQQDVALMSNMTPQLASLNRGFWKILEEETRDWAAKSNIVIFTGPIYSKSSSMIGNGVIVPHAFFKILVNINTNELVAFKVDNKDQFANFDSSISSVSEIQKLTGIKFNIPKNVVHRKTVWDKMPTDKTMKLCLIKKG